MAERRNKLINAGGLGGISLTDLAQKAVDETITGNWTFSGNPTFTGTVDFTSATLSGLSSEDLSDRATIAMTDEAETITGGWTFTGTTDFAAITATTYGGISEANLLDKTATETITGAWSFDGLATIISNGYLLLDRRGDANSAYFYMDTDASYAKGIMFREAGVNGWLLQMTTTGNFNLGWYNAGVYDSAPIVFSGVDGTVDFNKEVTFNTATTYFGELNPVVTATMDFATTFGKRQLDLQTTQSFIHFNHTTGPSGFAFGTDTSTLGTAGGVLVWRSSPNQLIVEQHDGTDLLNIDFDDGAVVVASGPFTASQSAFFSSNVQVDGDLKITGNIEEQSTTGVLNLYGGASATGANIELYGGSHATQANNAFYDADAHTFRAQNAASTYFTINSTQVDVVGIDLRVRDGQYLEIWDAADTQKARFRHTGTNLGLDKIGTTNYLQLEDGIGLRIYDSVNTGYGIFEHDDTDFNISFSGTTDLNISGLTDVFLSSVEMTIQGNAPSIKRNANATGGARRLDEWRNWDGVSVYDDVCRTIFNTGTGEAAEFQFQRHNGTSWATVWAVDAANSDFKVELPIFIDEQAAAATDLAGYGQLWVRSDTPNTFMFTDDAGTDLELLTDSRDYTVTGNWEFTQSITIEKTSGIGIKVDTAAPTFGWRDIIGNPQEPTVGSGKPSFSQIASSGVYTWSFATNDTQSYVFHIPHDYVPGTDIHFHVHWFGSQTAGGSTRWEIDYLYAQGHDQAAFPTTATTVNVQQVQSTTAYQHMIAETAAVTISGLEVDGLVIVQVTRIAPTGGPSDVSGSVFVPCVDIHYQSTNMATKDKAPNFYV